MHRHRGGNWLKSQLQNYQTNWLNRQRRWLYGVQQAYLLPVSKNEMSELSPLQSCFQGRNLALPNDQYLVCFCLRLAASSSLSINDNHLIVPTPCALTPDLRTSWPWFWNQISWWSLYKVLILNLTTLLPIILDSFKTNLLNFGETFLPTACVYLCMCMHSYLLV